MTITDHNHLYIGGSWKAPHSAERIVVRSASTEAVIGSVPEADRADVDAAVLAAREAFEDWSQWKPAARADVLHAWADAIDRRVDELAQRVSLQNGMPIFLSKASDSRRPGHLLRYYAETASQQGDEELRISSSGGSTLVRRVPLGVVAAVVPWNFPNTMAALKYAPALAAGCTVVLKPAAETVLDTILIADAAIEAGLPAGVLNIVTGGRETGRYLVNHPRIDEISFTGSLMVGRELGTNAGGLLRPVTLELGGKSAAIVLDDAELKLSAIGAQLAPALFGNNGQTCFITSRILAPRSRYDEVVDTVSTLALSLQVGNALDPATKIGPLVSERQRERVEGYIRTGREEGARLVVGGGRPAGLTRGWFVEPTVFADVDNASTIAQEEIFGPVVTVTPYDGDDEAVRLANDSQYGLAGTVWTTNADRGLAVARRIVTGSVGINHYQPDLFSPSSMIKGSGLGLKFGPEALATYQRYQSIYLEGQP